MNVPSESLYYLIKFTMMSIKKRKLHAWSRCNIMWPFFGKSKLMKYIDVTHEYKITGVIIMSKYNKKQPSGLSRK